MNLKNKKRIMILIICLIILLLILLVLNKVLDRAYYRVDSRVEDVEKARKKNSYDDFSVVGWIKVQGTNIDYPILSNLETKKYPVELEKYGWINTGDNKYHNVVNIYGHNIMNLGSHPMVSDETFNRFEELASFIYYDVAKKNKYIQLTMNGKDYIYKIFAVGIISNYSLETLPIKEYTNEEVLEYLDLIKKKSIYDYDINPSVDDKFITVSTCTRFKNNDYDSIYVAGVQVKDISKLENYNIKKNSNYKQIENIMSGGNSDEDNA